MQFWAFRLAVGRGYAKWRRRLHYLHLEKLEREEKLRAESKESAKEDSPDP